MVACLIVAAFLSVATECGGEPGKRGGQLTHRSQLRLLSRSPSCLCAAAQDGALYLYGGA